MLRQLFVFINVKRSSILFSYYYINRIVDAKSSWDFFLGSLKKVGQFFFFKKRQKKLIENDVVISFKELLQNKTLA